MEIVGLKNFVPDNVNNLIFKFVGLKPHPLAEIMVEAIECCNRYNRPEEESFVSFLRRNPLDEYYDTYCRCCNSFEKRPFGYTEPLCQCTESDYANNRYIDSEYV